MQPKHKLVFEEWCIGEDGEMQFLQTFKVEAHYNELLVPVPTRFYTTGGTERDESEVGLFKRFVKWIKGEKE